MPDYSNRHGQGPRRDSDRGGNRGHRDDRRDQPQRPTLDTSAIVLTPGAEGTLDPALFDRVARDIADKLGENGNSNKPAQIRQFYDELVMWEDRVRQEPGRFAEFLPFIRMLNAKAAYAQGRQHVDADFVALIACCLEQVQSAETLRNFKLFFEAFLGFYKLLGPKA